MGYNQRLPTDLDAYGPYCGHPLDPRAPEEYEPTGHEIREAVMAKLTDPEYYGDMLSANTAAWSDEWPRLHAVLAQLHALFEDIHISDREYMEKSKAALKAFKQYHYVITAKAIGLDEKVIDQIREDHDGL